VSILTRFRAWRARRAAWKALAEAIQRDDFEAACHYASLTGDDEVRGLALLARVDKALAETFGGERE